MTSDSVVLDEQEDTRAEQLGDALKLLNEPVDDAEERLADAGDFVAVYHLLADWYDEPDLSQVRDAAVADSPLGEVAHWSRMRGDGSTDPPRNFSTHALNCMTCAYLDGILGISTWLNSSGCADCFRTAAGHRFGPSFEWDTDGPEVLDWFNPDARCIEPWQGPHTQVVPAGTLGAHQISDGHYICWTAALADGTHAMLTRTIYLATEDGRTFVGSDDYLLVVGDLDSPEDTKTASATVYREIESTNPAAEDLAAVAAELVPQLGEFAGTLPTAAPFLWE